MQADSAHAYTVHVSPARTSIKTPRTLSASLNIPASKATPHEAANQCVENILLVFRKPLFFRVLNGHTYVCSTRHFHAIAALKVRSSF